MVRIGSGKFKGREIKTPDTRLTRVSTSYSRKVIFDTLMPYLQDATILDLFAGSGSLGIEGISRGAKSVLFIDSETKPYKTIKDNLNRLEINDTCTVLKKDVISFLNACTASYDLIFLDPPYSKTIEEIKHILTTIDKGSILNREGVICFEMSTKYAKEIIGSNYSHFTLFKEKKKGETTLLFFKP
ncbi:MAG: Ribosomal RNA small subunit methyltransferase D [Chlamydiia bacterium]|nr:Ribosomal RNA small subunit methyltransferase D [Chlamydiia bacterium]MCH9618547.1 Ribosomal RNA small subunit methyltransferase D [Chlamydiia bacterium]MCH9624255.1 Ribosomal RNA small subunit methyltransferase D [Chlamydiia bacterium]